LCSNKRRAVKVLQLSRCSTNSTAWLTACLFPRAQQRLSALAGRVVAANKRVLWWQARLRAAREVAPAAAAERASASAAATRRCGQRLCQYRYV